jgi:GxxExxY protein
MELNKITYAINGAIFEVSKVLGHGFLEKVYENALVVELQSRGLTAENQVPIPVTYKGAVVGEYIADVVVEGKVIVELKTVDKIEKIHEAQVIHYLKATGMPVGLLVNFKHPKVQIKRIALAMPQGHEDSSNENVLGR